MQEPEVVIQIQRTNKDGSGGNALSAIKELKMNRMKHHVLTNWQMFKTLITLREMGTS